MHFPFPHDLSLAFLLVSSWLKQSRAPAQLLPILTGEKGLSYLWESNLETSSPPVPEVCLLGGSNSCKVDHGTDPQGFHLTLIRTAVAKETDCSSCGGGCADRVTLSGCRLPQPQRKLVWRRLRKLTTEQTEETARQPQTDPK